MSSSVTKLATNSRCSRLVMTSIIPPCLPKKPRKGKSIRGCQPRPRSHTARRHPDRHLSPRWRHWPPQAARPPGPRPAIVRHPQRRTAAARPLPRSGSRESVPDSPRRRSRHGETQRSRARSPGLSSVCVTPAPSPRSTRARPSVGSARSARARRAGFGVPGLCVHPGLRHPQEQGDLAGGHQRIVGVQAKRAQRPLAGRLGDRRLQARPTHRPHPGAVSPTPRPRATRRRGARTRSPRCGRGARARWLQGVAPTPRMGRCRA